MDYSTTEICMAVVKADNNKLTVSGYSKEVE